MTDEELIRNLRKWAYPLMTTAADRIEQLLTEHNKTLKSFSEYSVLLQETEIQLEDAESVLRLLADWDQCWPSNEVERAAREARRIMLGEQ